MTDLPLVLYEDINEQLPTALDVLEKMVSARVAFDEFFYIVDPVWFPWIYKDYNVLASLKYVKGEDCADEVARLGKLLLLEKFPIWVERSRKCRNPGNLTGQCQPRSPLNHPLGRPFVQTKSMTDRNFFYAPNVNAVPAGGNARRGPLVPCCKEISGYKRTT